MHVLLTEDQELFRRTVREFAEREIAPVAAEHDEAETFPWANIRKMGQLGLMGLTVPVEHGGSGAGPVEYALAIEEVARADAAHAVILAVNDSLVCQALVRWGTDDQKERFLSRLCSGDMVGSFCLSEPHCGSDARAMKTTAVREGDDYILTGTKNWISNGGEAGLYVVFTKLAGEGDRTAAFLVEGWRYRMRTGPKERKLGIRASATTQVFLEECRIPATNRLGEEGDGFKIAMTLLDGGRVGVAAQALGIAQAAYDAAVAYAKQREAFGQPIAEFQGIQWMLADMHVRIEQSRLLIYQAALLQARGLPFAKESSMAKLSASETAMWVTTKAIQIHGGYGYSREYPVQRYFRDAKITEIYEGTSEIQRLVIARHILRGERAAPAEAVPETQTPVLELPPTPEELERRLRPKKLHHVAVAVDSVDEALHFYRDILGLDEIEVMTLEDRGLKVGLIKAGPSEVELLEPISEDSTVRRFLDRRGPGLHHVCFEVEDVEKSMRHFEGRGAEFLDPVPRPGAVGLVSFMPPSVADGVLVELAQTSGYELPAPEPAPEAVSEALAEAARPFVQPYVRRAGAATYTRYGLWTPPARPAQPAPAAPTESAADRDAEAAAVAEELTAPPVEAEASTTETAAADVDTGGPVAASTAEAVPPADTPASTVPAPAESPRSDPPPSSESKA